MSIALRNRIDRLAKDITVRFAAIEERLDLLEAVVTAPAPAPAPKKTTTKKAANG